MSKEFNIEALVEASDMEKKIADKVINAFKGMSKDEQAKFMKSYLKNPDAAVGYMFSNMQKMAMKEEKELDAVNPKALKGKFKDREDKDIDNDGDTDSSDEYLHKRRSAVSKAIGKMKEAVELDEAPNQNWADKEISHSREQERLAKQNEKTMKAKNAASRQFQKSSEIHAKTAKADHDVMKARRGQKIEEVELDEAKLSASQRDRLDDLILNVHMTTHPEYDGDEGPKKYLDMIRKEFGDKVAKQVDDGMDKVHWGRDNHTSGSDKLSWRKGNARITKSGKMNAQDVNALKNRIKRDKAWGGITKKVKLPEDTQIDEKYDTPVKKKPVSMMTKDEKDKNDERRKSYKEYQKSLRKESVELDELSAVTLGKYSQKARTDALDHSGGPWGKKKDPARVAKRLSGDAMAVKKLDKIRKEEVELDEISRDLARSYIRKAASTGNRKKGVEMAGKKAYSIGGEPKVRATEAKDNYTINHKTFSSAVQHAKAQVEKQGYAVDDDEWDRKVAMGPKKPGTGKTNRYTIDLMKGGKESRRKLQMQVYYDEGRYELNMYIS